MLCCVRRERARDHTSGMMRIRMIMKSCWIQLAGGYCNGESARSFGVFGMVVE